MSGSINYKTQRSSKDPNEPLDSLKSLGVKAVTFKIMKIQLASVSLGEDC